MQGLDGRMIVMDIRDHRAEQVPLRRHFESALTECLDELVEVWHGDHRNLQSLLVVINYRWKGL